MGSVLQEEIELARLKLADRIGDSKIGGKGAVRRKKKIVHKTQYADDKKIKPIIKKYGVQPFQGIEQVNMFMDDNSILHFNQPEVHASLQSNAFVVFGKCETKGIKEMLPEILQHMGQKQFGALQEIMQQVKKEQQESQDQNEEIPQLQKNFEEVSQLD